MEDLHFTKKDFRIEWFSGTGAGGQYRNKHQNCCRITHIDTGLMSTGQSQRDRPGNQKEAFNALAKKLITHYKIFEAKNRREEGEEVRKYHEPRNEVLDHASGIRKTYSEVVINGDIDELIIARHKALG